MKKKIWMIISLAILFITTFSIWNWLESSNQASRDFSKDVVNSPVSEKIVKMNSNQYQNGHEFISYYHEFYNETLCYGRIEIANYSNQKGAAKEIIETLKNIEVQNDKLKEDFQQIEKYAQKVVEKDDRNAMRMLHRLFHDLDIYFNGYSYNTTFGVTKFKGN